LIHVNIRIVLLIPEKEIITNRSKYVIFKTFDQNTGIIDLSSLVFY